MVYFVSARCNRATIQQKKEKNMLWKVKQVYPRTPGDPFRKIYLQSYFTFLFFSQKNT